MPIGSDPRRGRLRGIPAPPDGRVGGSGKGVVRGMVRGISAHGWGVRRTLVAAAATLLLGAVAGAAEFEGRLNDLARVLTPDAAARLEARLVAFEAETSHPLAVLTIPSLEGEPIAEFSVHAAENWRVGERSLASGILLVVVPRDHTARIEVGPQLGDTISDAEVDAILETRMLPLLREGRVADGIAAGVGALESAAQGVPPALAPKRTPRGGQVRWRGPDPITVMILAVVVGSLVGSPTRAGRLRAALVGGGLAGLVTWYFDALPTWIGVAVVLGALCGWFAPAARSAVGRRTGWSAPATGAGRSIGSGYGHRGLGDGHGGIGGGGATGRW